MSSKGEPVASRSALTEEGRTRIRNFSGRLNSYLVLWALVGIVAVIAAFWLRTRYGYLPLQRLYLAQYIKASIKSLIQPKGRSTYILLVRVIHDTRSGAQQIIACTDDQVIPVRDETGRVKFDPKLRPFFRLKEGVPHKYFFWQSAPEANVEIYIWMRDEIYEGHSVFGLYWMCFLPLPVVVIAGMITSARIDLRINREYEEGKLVRGIRLLGNAEYARENNLIGGLGLPVFRQDRDAR